MGNGHASGWIPSREEFDRFDAASKERAGEVLDEARAMAEQIGISVELLHIPNAHSATTIVETAKFRGCDLIVMGSNGRRAAKIPAARCTACACVWQHQKKVNWQVPPGVRYARALQWRTGAPGRTRGNLETASQGEHA